MHTLGLGMRKKRLGVSIPYDKGRGEARKWSMVVRLRGESSQVCDTKDKPSCEERRFNIWTADVAR